jgi:hypothetical protein
VFKWLTANSMAYKEAFIDGLDVVETKYKKTAEEMN